jgi:hypothetical protein
MAEFSLRLALVPLESQVPAVVKRGPPARFVAGGNVGTLPPVFPLAKRQAGANMGVAVASNALLDARAGTLRTLLNSSHTLRLFKNNFTPTPASILSAFTQADFTGYASVSLASQFGAQTKIVDGEYQINSGTYTFTWTGGSDQTVYGWYIDDGTDVKFSQTFPSAILMTTGVSFTLQVNPQEWAFSIVP